MAGDVASAEPALAARAVEKARVAEKAKVAEAEADSRERGDCGQP